MQIPRQYPQPIGSFHRPMVRRVAQHEVGHYVVAKALGFGTGSIDLTIFDLNGGHQAGSEIYPSCALRDMQGIDDYLERRITVLYAGALAESLGKGVINNDEALKSVQAGGGMRDYDKARELIHLLRSIRFPDTTDNDQKDKELNEIDNKLWNKAAEIVQSESEIIEGIGDKLASGIKNTYQKFTLAKAELDSLPIIIERFGKEVPANA